MLRVRLEDVCLSGLTVWGQLLNNSIIQLHIKGVSPNVYNLSTSLFGMMVIHVVNKEHTDVSVVSF